MGLSHIPVLVDVHGNLKICDFGLSRSFTSRKAYTPVVVTLWYRPPELLLGPVEYSTEIDQWSVGCIFGELVTGHVIFNGNNEPEQVDKIFRITGTPTEEIWPGFFSLPQHKHIRVKSYPNRLRTVFESSFLTPNGYDLLKRLLILNPQRRITSQAVLSHPYFFEEPAPVTRIDMLNKSDFIRYHYQQDQAQFQQMCNPRHVPSSGQQMYQQQQPPPPYYPQLS